MIDVESTCWKGDPPPGQDREIIEIGLCVLDVATCERLERRSLLVQPLHSTVSEYCTTLTTLTQEEVAQGLPFPEACRLLRQEYQANERVWASYGDYDRKMFRRQCQAHGVDYPFGDRHLNVKSLFALVYNLPHEVGLDEALKYLGFPQEGTHHRGDADAWNIARILGHILLSARQAGTTRREENIP